MAERITFPKLGFRWSSLRARMRQATVNLREFDRALQQPLANRVRHWERNAFAIGAPDCLPA
jgi:hypothetical protein